MSDDLVALAIASLVFVVVWALLLIEHHKHTGESHSSGITYWVDECCACPDCECADYDCSCGCHPSPTE